MVNTFAGDPDLVKSFNGKFDNAMGLANPPFTTAKIQDAIEMVLSFFDVLESDPQNLNMLCGICVPGKEMQLVKTSGKVVRSVGDYDYVGVGDSSLLRHLGQLLIDRQLRPYRSHPMAVLGNYLVLKAKAHIDGCGGDSNVFIIQPSGQIDNYSANFSSWEQKMLLIESRISRVAACWFNSKISEQELEKQIAELVRTLKQERHGV